MNGTPKEIPFMLELGPCGSYRVKSISLAYGFARLDYKYLCRTEDNKIMCFRFAQDARLAAKYNGWTYLGKSK